MTKTDHGTGKRALPVDMDALEEAFELRNGPFAYFLDTESGRCLVLPGDLYDDDLSEEMEEDAELVGSAPEGRFFRLDGEEDLRPSVVDAQEFVADVESEALRRQLTNALAQRRAAFRQFLDLLHQEAGELERWRHFSRQRLRENIADYLRSEGLEITYEPLAPFQPRNEARQQLLVGATKFVDRVKRLRGVQRIALIGSLATAKRVPNNVDLLVTVTSEEAIPEIAAAARKLQGFTQGINRGAAIFLASSSGDYLGRTCPWRECGPGIRQRCEAQTCGGHLYDDLQNIRLSRETIAAPPLEVWPRIVVRQELPADVVRAFGIPR